MFVLELSELLPVELLMFVWDIDPQTTLSAYRTRPIDLESDAVCRDCGGSEVDVRRLAGKIGCPVILERKQVDGVIVNLLRRHDECCSRRGRGMGGLTVDARGRDIESEERSD